MYTDSNTLGVTAAGAAEPQNRSILTVRSIMRLSERDAITYRRLYEKFGRKMGGVVASLTYNPPLPPEALRKMILGKLGEEFLNFSTMTM